MLEMELQLFRIELWAQYYTVAARAWFRVKLINKTIFISLNQIVISLISNCIQFFASRTVKNFALSLGLLSLQAHSQFSRLNST